MTNQQPVNVHIQTGTGEILRIVGTIMGFGGIGMMAWAFGQGSWAPYVSVGATAALVFFIRQLWGRQLIGLPTRSATGSDGWVVADAMSGAAQGRLARTKLPTLLAISVLYGGAFLAARELIAVGLRPITGGPVAGYASIAITAALTFFVGQILRRARTTGAATQAPAWAAVMAGREDQGDEEFVLAVARWVAQAATAYLQRCNVAILAVVSIGYGVGFLGVRQAISIGLHIFANLYIAAGVSLLLGSVVVMPALWPNMIASLRRNGVIRSAQPAAVAVQQPSAPAPAPTLAPVVEPPLAPTPTTTPKAVEQPAAPAPAAAPKKVRRVRKVEQPTQVTVVRKTGKKENSDVQA